MRLDSSVEATMAASSLERDDSETAVSLVDMVEVVAAA